MQQKFTASSVEKLYLTTECIIRTWSDVHLHIIQIMHLDKFMSLSIQLTTHGCSYRYRETDRVGPNHNSGESTRLEV